MSGAAAIVSLLKAYTALTTALGTVEGVAPAARIMAGDLPMLTKLPAISVAEISGVPRNTVAMNGATTLISERVQVTVQTKDWTQTKALLELVRKACAHRRGAIAAGSLTINVDSILPDSTGPELPDADTGLFTQSRDFLVKWRATN